MAVEEKDAKEEEEKKGDDEEEWGGEARRGRGRTEEECGNGPRVKSNLPHLP